MFLQNLTGYWESWSYSWTVILVLVGLGIFIMGGSLYPLDALKLAGVDMTTPDAVEKTYAVLAGYVDRLEKLTSA